MNHSETVDTDSLDGGDSDVGGTPGSGRSGRRHPFFQRSDSTIFLGCSPPDPFEVALVDALPLADQPHLLNPYSRKEELFGMPRQTVSAPDVVSLPAARAAQWPFDHLPTHMALSYRSTGAGILGSRVPQPPAVSDPIGALPPPPAHVAPNAEAGSSLAAESSVIVQPSTSAVPSRPASGAGPEPAYLGVLAKNNSAVAESSEAMSVESIPLPVTADLDRSVLPATASLSYSDLSLQPPYIPAHQQAPYLAPHPQHSVIVHPSTSSSSYHREPLELSVSSRESGEASRLRSPPAYDDLHASNNVCLDLTNPYRSTAVEIPATQSAARTSTSDTAP